MFCLNKIAPALLFSVAAVAVGEQVDTVQPRAEAYKIVEAHDGDVVRKVVVDEAGTVCGEVVDGSIVMNDSQHSAPPTSPDHPVLDEIIFDTMLRADSQGKLAFMRTIDGGDELRPFAGDAVRAYVGISQEQQKTFESAVEGDYEKEGAQMEQFSKAFGSYDQLSAEEQGVLGDELRQFFCGVIDTADTHSREILTDEQLERLQELELTQPSVSALFLSSIFFQMDSGEENEATAADAFAEVRESLANLFTNVAAYDALGLTDEQRQKLREIQDADLPERQAMLKDLIKWSSEDKLPSREVRDAWLARAKSHGTLVKAKLLAVLTPEQREKLERLTVSVRERLAHLATLPKDEPEDDSWKNSWKP
ncbi:MAG: Spy/CpxP family protein refolding chaperone, partial [Thermoguttaceae bacterium]